MPDSLFQKFLDRNEYDIAGDLMKIRVSANIHRQSLSSHQAFPSMKDIVSMKGLPGAICILTCSDARVDPTQYLGMKVGEALVIRNAGGRAVDAFRSLSIMGSIAPISLIAVVHHTDCGGLFTTDDEVRGTLSKRAPAHASEVKDRSFGCFQDIGLEESIRQDVEMIRNWEFLPAETRVLGYALDIETGVIRELEI